MQLHSSSSFTSPSLLHTHSHKRPMHSHAAVMEKNIRCQNQDSLIIPKHTFNARVFTLCGNPLWCDTCSSSPFPSSFHLSLIESKEHFLTMPSLLKSLKIWHLYPLDSSWRVPFIVLLICTSTSNLSDRKDEESVISTRHFSFPQIA